MRSAFIQHQSIEHEEETMIICVHFCARVDLFNENALNIIILVLGEVISYVRRLVYNTKQHGSFKSRAC